MAPGSDVSDQLLVRGPNIGINIPFFESRRIAGPFNEKRDLRFLRILTNVGGSGLQPVIFIAGPEDGERVADEQLRPIIGSAPPWEFLDPQSDISSVVWVSLGDGQARVLPQRLDPGEVTLERGRALWYFNVINITVNIAATFTWGL